MSTLGLAFPGSKLEKGRSRRPYSPTPGHPQRFPKSGPHLLPLVFFSLSPQHVHQCMKVHQSVWYPLHHREAPSRYSPRSTPLGVERIGVFWSCAPVLRKEPGRITLEYSRQGGKCLYSQHSGGRSGKIATSARPDCSTRQVPC